MSLARMQATARRAGKTQATYLGVAFALGRGKPVFMMTDNPDESIAGVRRHAPDADIERVPGGLRISPGRTPPESSGKKEIAS